MNKQLKNLIKIYAISFFLVIVTMVYRHVSDTELNILNINIKGLNNCDLWCVSHIILYIILGYFAPNYWHVAILLGVLWELFEKMLENKQLKYAKSKSYDIVRNIAGLGIGIVLSRL